VKEEIENRRLRRLAEEKGPKNKGTYGNYGKGHFRSFFESLKI